MRAAADGHADRGSATLWVVACCALLVVIGGVGTIRGTAVLARHRAESAADLAAVAAAGQLGTDGEPCAAARRVAAGNGAALASCRVRLDVAGRGGAVDVAVEFAVRLPVIGRRSVGASARAGRRPAAGGAPVVAWAPVAGAPVVAGVSRSTALRAARVWHAGSRSPSPGGALSKPPGR